MAMGSRDGSYHLGEATSRLSTSARALQGRSPIQSGCGRELPEVCCDVLTACPNCDLRIRGDYFLPGVIGVSTASRPSFCDECGSAFPWATREERIFELENLLDEEDIEEADRVVIQDELRRLGNAVLTEKDERQAWSVVGRRPERPL
jgi:hypothetical protein